MANGEIFQRKDIITAETNVHEFKPVEESHDSYISGNCCCFSWCPSQVIHPKAALYKAALLGPSSFDRPFCVFGPFIFADRLLWTSRVS